MSLEGNKNQSPKLFRGYFWYPEQTLTVYRKNGIINIPMQFHIIQNFHQLICILGIYGSAKVSTSRIKSGWFDLDRNHLLGIIIVKNLKSQVNFLSIFIDYEKGNLTDIVKRQCFSVNDTLVLLSNLLTTFNQI